MSTGSLLLGAAVILLVGLYLARPFLLATSNQRSRITARQELLGQKETILAQIEILDFDYETGTLPELDYKQQRRQLVTQAAEILKKLDSYADMPDATGAGSVNSEIEAAIAALRQPKPRRAAKPTPKPVPAPTPIPQPTPNPVATATSNGKVVKFCSQCGQSVDPGDKFCASCGQKVQA